MCGISGFINRSFSQPEGEAFLSAMLNRIRHRGPDGAGVLIEPQRGLFAGMRRLSIIDLEGGAQPIYNEDRTIGVLFNGEIYNYPEIKERLQTRGHQFHTACDTEVLVHLYEEYGAEMFTHIRGMFAFMVYDSRKGKLMIARDHFGQKPLYYYVKGNHFAFASELKSLLTLPFIRFETDSEALIDFLTWFSLPAPQTHFHNLKKLPAGSFMEIPISDPSQLQIKTFWRFSAKEPASIKDLEEGAEALDSAIDESVRIHLRSDVPVGVLLSSGLDSKTIGTYAGRHLQGLSTFTAGYANEGSEFEGARLTAKQMGATHYEVHVTPENLAEDIERVAWHLDEPIGDAAAFAILRVCEFAREHVKVLLSGEGADELLGGYADRYDGMIRNIERSEVFRKLRHVLPQSKNPFPTSRLGRFRQRAHMIPSAEIVRFRVEGLPGDIRDPRGFTKEQLLHLQRRENAIGKKLVRWQRDILHTLLAFDIDWQLADSLLLKADKMSMAASIELRTPFLDVSVASLAARMDTSIKLQDGIGKRVLRRCLARHEPGESMSRPKAGFPIPLADWLRGSLREHVSDDLFRKKAYWREVLDSKLIEPLWDDFQNGDSHFARVFYAMWLYETWRYGLTTHSSKGI